MTTCALGFEPDDEMRWMARLAVFNACRDAHIAAEGANWEMQRQRSALWEPSESRPIVAEPPAHMPSGPADEAASFIVPDDWKSMGSHPGWESCPR